MKNLSLIFSIIVGISLLSMMILPFQQQLVSAEILDKKDLDFEITGGSVTSFHTDEIMGSLIVTIQTESDGQLTISLPRTFLDSVIGDEYDDFFILIDGEEVFPEEILTTSKSRTFMIPFENGIEEIEIIGTSINVLALSVLEPKTSTDTTTDSIQGNTENGGGGCLIATATFGSELAPQVQQLREFRDNTILSTESGTTFMTGFNQLYYSFSPTIADMGRQNPIFKEMVKITLTPLLASLSILNYVDINSENEMLGYGISLILLNVGMYVAAPAAIIINIRKKLLIKN